MVELLFFVIGPIFFFGFWVLICLGLSNMGGWKNLAESYPGKKTFFGKQFTMRDGYLGKAHYRTLLTLGANSRGLHISVLFAFRIGHPPIFIPWSDISAKHKKRLMIYNMVELTFAKNPERRLEITYDLARDLANASRGSFQLDKPTD